MRIFLLLLLVYTADTSFGQFALIDDKDGFVNIRSSAERKNNITDTLKNGHIVWCFEPEGNWISVDYQKNGESLNGYVYKTRIRYLASFDSIPIYKLDKRKVILKKDSLLVTITEADFAAKNNFVKYEMNNSDSYVSKINGKPVWGNDGNIPKREYKTIKVQIGKRSISIPKSELQNLFEPNLDYSECYYDRQKDVLYLSALNSDGAGGYAVLWIIQNGTYKNKIVTIPF